jgi:hypothetical protein
LGIDLFSAALLGNALRINTERDEVTVIEAGQPDRVLHRRPAPAAAWSTATPIFLRGSFNDWSAANSFARVGATNEWVARQELKAGRYEFKVASADFRDIDLGASPVAKPLAPDQNIPLFSVGSNLVVSVDKPGWYQFNVDLGLETARLKVTAED